MFVYLVLLFVLSFIIYMFVYKIYSYPFMNCDNTYKSKAVFNYFYERAQAEGIPLTPMKAIKLVYFAHAWNLGFYQKPLINEPVEAWKFGTVIPSLYQSLKIYGASAIGFPIIKHPDVYYLDLLVGEYDKIPEDEIIETDSLTAEEQIVIDAVWNNYKTMDGLAMSDIIHQKGTPWAQVWNDGNCERHAIIPNDLIQEYYSKKIKQQKRKDE